MVAGYHLIWTVYGAWLPNDPRGSMSTEIRSPILEDLGAIHHGRKKTQPAGSVIRRFYQNAKPKLKYDLLTFSEVEIQTVAEAFADVIKNRGYTCYACAIMPDHIHLLTRKHRDLAEDMIGYFQDESWRRIIALQNRPSDHPVWGGPGWKVYLNTCADIERTIRYILDNPIKARMPEQTWPFVRHYDGWLPGIGARK
jgi:REP element-mobilizing transposase RayT